MLSTCSEGCTSGTRVAILSNNTIPPTVSSVSFSEGKIQTKGSEDQEKLFLQGIA